MSKFIVIEGLDGSGKSTQINLLKEYFKNNNLPYKFIHFPRLNNPIIGEMISSYLRGEFGDIDSVDPYFVALMYALDRNNAKNSIQKWLQSGYYVLIDRYVYSNVAFQCAKVNDAEKKGRLKDWIISLEYEFNCIPKPDISFFMYMPFDFIVNTLEGSRTGEDRLYLKGSKDIHESSLVLQKNVEAEYLSITKSDEDFKLVPCYNVTNELLNPKDINALIINEIKKLL